MHIIETIGSWGVRTTPHTTRLNTPKPGDIVDASARSEYPFKSKHRCYIERVDGDEITLCIGGCSMFLQESGHVSISGGPFACVSASDLEPTFSTASVQFWNWGDNSPGAAQGVYYDIERPIFKLKREAA